MPSSTPIATIKLNTGALIPQIGLGTWQATDDAAYNAVLAALKIGYRHIDTAAIYKNERLVGKAIKDSGVPREEIFVTTKLWGTQHQEPEQALDDSLQRLGLEYVDLYLIHWPVPLEKPQVNHPDELLTIPTHEDGTRKVDLKNWNFIKTWEAVQKLVATGKAKAIGVSNFSIANIEELLNAKTTTIVPAVNQVEIHPLLPQSKLIEYAKSKGIVIEAYSPLGSSNSPLFTNATLQKIADSYSVSIPQLLINWALKRGYVVLPKSNTPSRIEENFKTFELKDTDFSKINSLSETEGEQRIVKPAWGSFPIFE